MKPPLPEASREVPASGARSERLRHGLPWLVLALCLLVTLLGWRVALRYVQQHRESAFHEAVSGARHDIEQRMESYRQILLGAGGLVRASNDVSREEFRAYYQTLQLEHRYPGLVGIGYAIVFGPEELAAHERRMRAEGFANYRVLPPGRRERYSAIIFGEPIDVGDNQRALGLDMLTDESRRQAMERARDTGNTALTSKLRLFLGADAANQTSVIMYVPVYRTGAPVATVEERRKALIGYTFAGFRMDELMLGIFGQQQNADLDLRLYDGDQIEPGKLLYDSVVHAQPDLPDAGKTLHSEVLLDLPGGMWTAAFSARARLIENTSSRLPDLTLYGGLLLDAMLFALLLLYGRSERRILAKAQEKADAMTSELRASEGRFRLVVQASPGGILLVDRSGCIEMANVQAERMFGYEEGGLTGVAVEALMPAELRGGHQALRESYMLFPTSRAMGAGRELSGVRRDGSELALEIALSPVQTERGQMVLAALTDITERRAAEQHVVATRALLEGVIDSASEFSIIATTMTGLITVFNTGAQRMLGYSAEEMVGKQTPAIIHDPDELRERGEVLSAESGERIEGFEVCMHAARAGRTEAREWRYIRKDGSALPVNLTVSLIHGPGGEAVGFIGIAYDISARRQTEWALAAARDHAEATSRSKSEFLSNMSHEIRTPLNAVLGMAQLLGFSKLDGEQREYLRMIEVSGKTLLGILNDILDFSKIEAGRLDLAPAPFYMQDMTDALADIMQSSTVNKDLDLSIDIDPAVPSSLLGDQLRLQQILINLLGNAIKFTQQGEVNLRVQLVEIRGDDVQLRFTVRDSGIGMSEEQIGRLFIPFSQADSSMTRRFGGSGLGLAICKRLVEMMGGQIGVSSMPARGSSFRFTVWLKRVPQEQGMLSQSLAGLEVRDLLLVEASSTAVGSIASAAGALGVSCESCASESEAMACIITRGRVHDVVLIDWNMPDRGRDLLLSQLRGKASTRHAIVLGISSVYGREAMSGDPLAVSLDGVLIKPVTSSTLLDSVMQACAKRDSARDLRKLMQVPELQLRARSLRGARLLLVEDNTINQMVARGILQQAGAIIDIAGNGQEAVEQLRRHPGLYVMVLMDVQMPVMDGCTATRLIRSELQLRLPIVAMTAGVLQSQREECMAAGMTDFLSKPLDAQLTIDTLERVLLGAGYRPAGVPETDPSARAAVGAALAATPVETVLEEPIEGVDQATALARIGGNQALYRELLLQFRIEASEVFAATRRFLDEGALRDAGRGFHTLKSTAASVGALALAELARGAEAAVQAGDIRLAQQHLETIHDELERLLPAISRALEQSRLSPAQASSAVMGVDRVALQQLLQQLLSHDLDALDAFEYLRAGLPGVFGATDAERLTLLISGLDFDPAAALLEKLISQS
ncbi:CHASE domain-containing protein [Uliginosibacterium sp. 31-16]|uniref:CHASE domain-containing protein n=1 Tax=Uliginosibacterium sp. 31-16 TaxID=3068315 RepID=UPI00273E7A2D|nr:CHASE domain-containing protein [Uliginosibacterium sp. 31-16]MDP5240333.1 CHASE domain-containing protein [Uliginosibacterium sp. 31-16]